MSSLSVSGSSQRWSWLATDNVMAELARAQPVAQAVFTALSNEAGPHPTPEDRARLMNRLMETAGKIEDKTLAAEYRREWKDLFFAARPRRGFGGKAVPAPSAPPHPLPDAGAVTLQRLRLLTAILLRHPMLLHDLQRCHVGVGAQQRLRVEAAQRVTNEHPAYGQRRHSRVVPHGTA